MRLKRDDVIDAALAVLDTEGLDALTTRRLADRLGVRVGGLYWHVKDKRELLAAVAERIVGEADHPVTGDWARQLADRAHRLRVAMLNHRDGARVVAGYAPVSVAVLRQAEEGLRVMQEYGFSLAAAAYAGDTMMSYVTGFVLQEQAPPPDGDGLDPTAFPLLAEWTRARPRTKDTAFAAGVDQIISGIRAALPAPPVDEPSAPVAPAGQL